MTLDSLMEWISSLDEAGLTENQVIGLAMLRAGQALDNPAYRNATGVDSRVATSDLQDLVSRGLAEQLGSKRWFRYLLAEAASELRDDTEAPNWEDRRRQVLEVLGSETLLQRHGEFPERCVATGFAGSFVSQGRPE